ncbi:MAG: TIGR01777 family protein [Methylococcaceae bacterium]|nr:MAG: TIGR01777 family protein [Methylococcaceae bacterium]
MNILITGGTGLLGNALVHHFLQHNHTVTVLSRSLDKVQQRFGSKVHAIGSLSDNTRHPVYNCIINLAGAGIFDTRWSSARKQCLRDSRIELTKNLIIFMEQMPIKPQVFLSGSAIGIYGDQGDKIVSEQAPQGSDFSAQLCADWEAAALQAEALGIRTCLLRTGLVLAHNGGFLQRMLPAFKMGLGGQLGSGLQWMPWVHYHDWLASVQWLIDSPTQHGAFNITSPHPVTNQEFTKQLAKALHRPACCPVPSPVLHILLGERAELLLGSQRVLPTRLQENGFTFTYEDLPTALAECVN